jgi:hypothetical protein
MRSRARRVPSDGRLGTPYVSPKGLTTRRQPGFYSVDHDLPEVSADMAFAQIADESPETRASSVP